MLAAVQLRIAGGLLTPAAGGVRILFRPQSIGRFACLHGLRFDGGMAPRFLAILTGRNLPKIRQPREPEPSTINEKTIADFTRVVEQTGILKQGSPGPPDEH
jgi:hypothetical protein